MADDTSIIATQWKALNPQQRDQAMQRMTPDQKQKLAQQLGMRGGRGPMYMEAGPPKFSLPWWKSQVMTARDKAINYLPTVGGTVGGIIGAGAGEGLASIPLAAAGAAAGGTLGEDVRQSANEYFHPENKMSTRESVKGLVTQGLEQGGAELLAGGLGKAFGPSLKNTISKLYFAGHLGPREDLELVMPEVLAAEKGQPAKTVGDFIKIVEEAKTKIGNEVDTAMMHRIKVPGAKNMVPLAGVSADTTPIADRISLLATAHPSDIKFNPGRIAAIKQRVAQYSTPETYAKLNDRRTVLNKELSRFYSMKTPADQAQYLFQHPEFEIDKAEADAIRDTIYPQMDKATGKPAGYFENLQRKRGALMSIEDQAQEHIQALRMKSKQSAGAPMGDPLRAYTSSSGHVGMTSRISALAHPFHPPNVAKVADKQVARAFSRTPGSKVGKAAASPAGREVMALPLRLLANPNEPENAPAPRQNATDEWSGPQPQQ